MIGGSAGRATGRAAPLKGDEDAFGAAGLAGARPVDFLVAVLAELRPLVLLRFAGARFAAVFLAPLARLAVVRRAVLRFAVVFFLAPARFAGLRLALVFFVDDFFFFAGISPPSAMRSRIAPGDSMRMRTRCCYLRFIASAPGKDKHQRRGGSIAHDTAGAGPRIARADQFGRLELDQLGRPPGFPIADQPDIVAKPPQGVGRLRPEAALQAQAGIG